MPEAGPAPIVAAEGVVRRYPVRGGMTAGRRAGRVSAVDGISLALLPGEILGVVGRSGAGKSTLARLLLGLESPDEGVVRYAGRPLSTLSAEEERRMRRAVQAVFQDPSSSLDPRQAVGSIVAEPLAVHRLSARPARRARSLELLAAVGLGGDPSLLDRRSRQLSGGERQRVAIARALACEPVAVILDEPVSALDVSVRGQVLNLLLELQARTGLALLVIAHDVALVARLCTRVAVLADGRIVEEGAVDRVLRHPTHPATREVVDAARWLERAPWVAAAPTLDGEPGAPI